MDEDIFISNAVIAICCEILPVFVFFLLKNTTRKVKIKISKKKFKTKCKYSCMDCLIYERCCSLNKI